MSLSESLNSFINRLRPFPRRIYNLGGSSSSLLASLLQDRFIFVAPDEESAERFHKDILFFKDVMGQKKDVFFFPSEAEPTATGERAKILYNLLIEGREGSVVTSSSAMSESLWSPEELIVRAIAFKKGVEARREDIAVRLETAGYRQVSLVTEPGEFSQRQWLLDIFPPDMDNPVRIEFFGDTVEGIRTFDASEQRSIEEIHECTVMPINPPTEGGATLTELLKDFGVYYMGMDNDNIPIDAIILSRYAIEGEGIDAGTFSFKGLGISPEERKDIDRLASAIGVMSRELRTVLVSPSNGQAKRLHEILRDGGIIAPIIEVSDILSYEGNISISVGGLSEGLFIPGIIVITEHEMFRRPQYRPIKKTRGSGLASSMDSLMPGDYVVHKDKGIGVYMGLTRQSIEGVDYDLMIIEYLGGDRLFIPIHAINRVTKYFGGEDVIPKIDRLGGKSWQKTKERVKAKVRELADKLLKLYAERELSEGTLFSEDTELHREFDGFFAYEETPDQLRAIEEILSDMRSLKPMDRLVCGDVGYGKTEVAMRAVFRAVFDGYQSAVIVPTTLLCEQHLRTFRSRFSAFPFRIEAVSRFRTIKERDVIFEALERGDVDIVIGTHSLLKPNIQFKNLGLLVIDEEHRFGVGQKEKIKELKKGVDVLTLTATPIPRTLQMSLTGIRAMSVIETPPEERLAVQSRVSLFYKEIIREAIERELSRGGQVFFVHNRIADIQKIADFVRELLPSVRTSVAHGQMHERELDKIMLTFLDGKIDVLVSTSIIGSGIDIPTANTIIINRADMMGIADLYQLKGRVGRSNQKAYAFFLIPGWDAINDDAKKRLHAIQEMSYLGAGLKLAMKDLEIRGAGNLLGHQQSGNIDAVGFDMYTELLEEAVSEIKGIPIKEKLDTQIDININAVIPDSYIEDMTLRLTAYRKLTSTKSSETLKLIEDEMRDRFGPLPPEFVNLMGIIELKLMCEQRDIRSIRQSGDRARFVFSKEAGISADGILQNINSEKLRFYEDGFEIKLKGETIGHIKKILEAIT